MNPPGVFASVLSLDGTADSGVGRTLPPAQFSRLVRELLPPKQHPWSLQALREHLSLVSSSRGRATGDIGLEGWEGGLRPYSSLPDCIATQACLQSLPLPTAQFDQIRAPSCCGSAKGQEDTRRGQR